MAFPSPEELKPIAHPLIEAHNLDLEELKVNQAGAKSKVLIKVDSDDHPDSEILELISRELSAAFETAEEAGKLNFGPGYTIEVSTPGVDQPLTHARRWRRNRGRLVRITGGDFEGDWRIGALNDAQDCVVLIATTGKEPSVRTLNLSSDLGSGTKAVVKIEFTPAPQQQRALAIQSYDQATDGGERKDK